MEPYSLAVCCIPNLFSVRLFLFLKIFQYLAENQSFLHKYIQKRQVKLSKFKFVGGGC